MSVIDLTEHQKHILIVCDDGNHIMPEKLLRDVANGKKLASILTEPVLKSIIQDYVDNNYWISN